MAINFTDSPSNGATQTISGRTYTYNSAKNKWDTTATEVTGPTATVYASVDNLPTSGNITGSQAFVSGTNRLYIWNGSGWYNIALINNTPTISGASSSYALAIDGTATTVTLVATDPEGLPVTYSIASDTSGNIATVAQGTGASTNVFTITPSTNTAHAGTFSLTFRASDGINLATAVSSFTLAFSVANSKYTTALITSVGANNATNVSFDDKSTSNHTLTAANQATQNTFSPYRHGGYSTYFDGSGDYLTLAEQTSSAYGTAAFTIETWAYFTAGAAGSAYRYLFGQGSSTSGTNNLGLYIQGNVLKVWHNGAATITGTTTISLDTWYHIALVRNGTTLKLYLNGAEEGSVSNSSDITSTSAGISISRWSEISDTQDFAGYMRDFRIVKGTAVYTSAFNSSLPDAPLTAITNTSLLTCHLPYIGDGSTNSHSITINGNTSVRPFAPYDSQEYIAADHSGSICLDGTTDRISAAASTDFGFGTGDFTVEWWIYFNSITNYEYQIDMRSADNDTPLSIFTRTNLQNQIGIYVSNTVIASGTYSFKPGIWTHYAICKTGGYLKGYFNGKEDFSISCTRDYGTTEAISIGSVYGNNNYYVNGNMADVRIVKGTAIYTSAFSPPTAPLTAVTNTKLLVQSTDAGIIDKAQVIKDFRLSGNVKSSTTQNKFLTSSIYFDGSGDYMRATNNEGLFDLGFNGDPFTIEWWQWWPTIQNTKSLGPQTGGGYGGWNGSTGHQLTLFTYSSSANLFYQWWNGSSRTDYEFNHGGAITASTWQHWATVYDGTNFSTYIDGTRIGHRTSGNAFGSVSTKYITLGSSVDLQNQTEIYYSDVRITKGLARYSGTTLTVPTAALDG
tara:strand:- start:440 stop:2992 length:2553 start_codon:yes stop_codon:yes gene_type:complete